MVRTSVFEPDFEPSLLCGVATGEGENDMEQPAATRGCMESRTGRRIVFI
jgi:hypothetical protein